MELKQDLSVFKRIPQKNSSIIEPLTRIAIARLHQQDHQKRLHAKESPQQQHRIRSRRSTAAITKFPTETIPNTNNTTTTMFRYKQLRLNAAKFRAKTKKKIGATPGKRLAKRSIVGTRVCALGADRKWYSGIITQLKPGSTPPRQDHPDGGAGAAMNVNPDSKYVVRFDKQDMSSLGVPAGRRLVREFRETELIGPGFQSVMSVLLVAGQQVYITYNGRESAGQVVRHDEVKDEVMVRIPGVGNEVSLSRYAIPR